MTVIAARRPARIRLVTALVWTGILAALGFALAPLARPLLAQGAFHPHAPDLSLWLSQGLAIQTHLYTAVSSFVLGVVILALPKGSSLHKRLGWVWVVLMAVTALTSLFITELTPGRYSFIHLITGWTLIALPMGIYAIRRRNIRVHRSTMVGLFIGGMIIAGSLTLLPGRLMYRLFLG